MQVLVFIAVLMALVVGPHIWVRRVMQRYSRPADRYLKSGAETARTLLDAAGLQAARVESTDSGDHYDPAEKAVRLSGENFNSRSLTATAIAAHEVGHAVQDASGFAPLKWRTRLVKWVGPIEKMGAAMMMATRRPSATSPSARGESSSAP